MGVALITPFKEDESVDYDALMRLVDYQLQNNTDFLCVLGTTAETPTLTEEEKKKIKKMVIERVNGRIPILLGVGGNNTRAIVETLKNDDFTGVDAILSVVPYYNKPSQEGIYQHYKAISEATDLPIVLYNVPGRTGVNMKAETTLRIARDFKNVIAVKEASGDITQMDDIIKNKPANFDVISGDELPVEQSIARPHVTSFVQSDLPVVTVVLTTCVLDFGRTEVHVHRFQQTSWNRGRNGLPREGARITTTGEIRDEDIPVVGEQRIRQRPDIFEACA
jgi:hypothetical protein